MRGVALVRSGALDPTAPGARLQAVELAHPAPRPFATVQVARTVADAAAAWSHLEAIALASPYQQRDWIDAWVQTAGRAAGLTPTIVIAFDAAGAPVALLPLGTGGGRLVRRAVFLGGPQTNYNMGLFDPRLAWTATDAEDLLRLAGRDRAGRVDLFELTNQPLSWAGFANPLAGLPRTQPSPSSSHSAVLQPDGDALMQARLSTAARKKLRAKTGHLDALGPVVHHVARSDQEIVAAVEAHLLQKAAKLAGLGIAVPDFAPLRLFFQRAAGIGGAASLELHMLQCGDRIVATFGGLAHAGRFSGTLISYEIAAPYARSSPGELLLNAVIRAKCAAGFGSFDLGVGEARYKDSYCPIEEPLVDGFLALTTNGRLALELRAARLRTKSAIKRSPRLWSAAQALRKEIGRLRPRP